MSKSDVTEAGKIHALLDSVNVLVNAGGVFFGYATPPTAEETRYMDILLSLHQLPLAESRNLMKDSNPLRRIYGFSAACKSNYENINSEDLSLFNDTTTILFYTKNGNENLNVTVGILAQEMYNSMGITRKQNEKRSAIIDTITSFIKHYATHPDSYKPVKFENYSWGNTDSTNYSYEITHWYLIINNRRKKEHVTQYFVLDKDEKINIIENKRSATFHTDPPNFSDWFSRFGKQLSSADSIHLNLKWNGER